jgi:dsRNA-specific ribonuclease
VSIIENVIDFSELISKNDNFKDSLQRFFQSLKFKVPSYYSINEEGPLYRKVFTRILLITKEQFDILDGMQQKNIRSYTEDCLTYYKTKNNNVFIDLFNKTKENYNYILAIGIGQKLITAEQSCAEQGLKNLNLSSDF